jgi:2-polyprenyl-3-methyl-5-hydroxy-6-metoxy-1,4-benzoquinol methylase
LTGSEHSVEPHGCRICGASTGRLGDVHGIYSDRDYELRRCDRCGYAFISNPWTDFARIYDDRYYAGQGADPMVDYRFELADPARTIRQYEWRGLTRIVEQLLSGLAGVRWLDFGAGNGGLVRHVLQTTAASATGFEEGSIAASARTAGIPMVSAQELEHESARFDVVTAIEVLEHTLDPVAELRRIRRLLRPGGLLLLTTGNAAPFAGNLPRWSYVVPEIHISFFEPRTLVQAFAASGLRPDRMPARNGFDEVLKFKVLKNLKIRRRSVVTDLIPARPLAAVADRRTQLSRHPVGWAA